MEVNATHRLESQATSTRKTKYLLSVSLLRLRGKKHLHTNAKTGVSVPVGDIQQNHCRREERSEPAQTSLWHSSRRKIFLFLIFVELTT